MENSNKIDNFLRQMSSLYHYKVTTTCRLWRSLLVDPDEIFDFVPADRTLFQIFGTFDTGSVVFTRHVDTILIIFIADDTGIGICFETDHCSLDFAGVGLARTDFEDDVIVELEEGAGLGLEGESTPGAVGGA